MYDYHNPYVLPNGNESELIRSVPPLTDSIDMKDVGYYEKKNILNIMTLSACLNTMYNNFSNLGSGSDVFPFATNIQCFWEIVGVLYAALEEKCQYTPTEFVFPYKEKPLAEAIGIVMEVWFSSDVEKERKAALICGACVSDMFYSYEVDDDGTLAPNKDSPFLEEPEFVTAIGILTNEERIGLNFAR